MFDVFILKYYLKLLTYLINLFICKANLLTRNYYEKCKIIIYSKGDLY